jgi:hypothetical protein
VSFLPADRLPTDPDGLERRREARAILSASEAFLTHPAFVHRAALSVLAKLMTDDAVPPRERRRAAEILARIELEGRRDLANFACVKEMVLRELGLSQAPGAQAVAIAQTVMKLEIVRETDWRDGGEREAAGG